MTRPSTSNSASAERLRAIELDRRVALALAELGQQDAAVAALLDALVLDARELERHSDAIARHRRSPVSVGPSASRVRALGSSQSAAIARFRVRA